MTIGSHALLLLVQAILLSTSILAKEYVYEVVPKEWILRGCGGADQDNNCDNAIIFPSTTMDSPAGNQDLKMEVENLLQKQNRISTTPITFYVKDKTDVKHQKEFFICAQRLEKESGTLVFSVDAKTLQKLKSLPWGRFQEIQIEFERWLSRQAQRVTNFGRPGSMAGARITRNSSVFNEAPGSLPCFESGSQSTTRQSSYYLRSLDRFWLKVLEGADFKAFAHDHLKPMPSIKGLPGTSGDEDLGPRYNAIPLREGMRLAIHWGGTAVYNYDSVSITRQTTGGTSLVEIISQNKKLGLSTLRDETFSLSMAAKRPHSTDIADDTGLLPFGHKLLPSKMVPVQSHIDLYNKSAFRCIRDNDSSSPQSPSFLTLLMPTEYVKSDEFGQEGTANRENTKDTSDALAEGEFQLLADDRPITSTIEKTEKRKEERKSLAHRIKETQSQTAALVAMEPSSDMAKAVKEVELVKLKALLDHLAALDQLLEQEEGEETNGGGQQNPDEDATRTKPSPTKWVSALSRRFMVFASDRPYRSATDAPQIPKSPSIPTSLRNWTRRPMVFGNQTVVEAQVLVFSGNTPEWIAFNSSWDNVIQTRNADFVARSNSGKSTPALVVKRFATLRDSVRTFRFHTFSQQLLANVRVHPSDTFTITP